MVSLFRARPSDLRLGALLLVRDQAAVAFSSAAVLRPEGSPLMPLRRTTRRPDPARLRQGCGKAALRYRDLCCHARPRSGLVQSVVPSLAALRLAANQSAASRVPGPRFELGMAMVVAWACLALARALCSRAGAGAIDCLGWVGLLFGPGWAEQTDQSKQPRAGYPSFHDF